MKYLSTFLIMFFSTQLYCKNWDKLSARRPRMQSFETSVFNKSRTLKHLKRTGSAYSSAVPYEQLDFSRVPKWSEDNLRYAYSRIRDERFIKTAQNLKFPRRSSWLYPYDGCWARAALSAIRSAEWGYKRPSKVFVFGDLEVKTPNAENGVVTWWYHVVTLVRDEKGSPIVFDPAIQAKSYLPLKEWLDKMGDYTKMQIAICNSFTYGPMDSCEFSNYKNETEALNDQVHYLPLEWSNLEKLNRNPAKELGDEPPWSLESLFGL